MNATFATIRNAATTKLSTAREAFSDADAGDIAKLVVNLLLHIAAVISFGFWAWLLFCLLNIVLSVVAELVGLFSAMRQPAEA